VHPNISSTVQQPLTTESEPWQQQSLDEVHQPQQPPSSRVLRLRVSRGIFCVTYRWGWTFIPRSHCTPLRQARRTHTHRRRLLQWKHCSTILNTLTPTEQHQVVRTGAKVIVSTVFCNAGHVCCVGCCFTGYLSVFSTCNPTFRFKFFIFLYLCAMASFQGGWMTPST
jgi:hypothetical protein